ncbi:hypothetical protein [Hymenobacter cheonanensis]|uniref:hypothetical protein n=1 Tax=Hymenobacter sp. CA2-7 TaxID=3063993 RepID=UPI00271270E6|nr:hypothetical protein [Hymenobacter sp. CA2-7]MDO7885889.1 hypothetical protein [Hymenobacter sp. CA2-7]
MKHTATCLATTFLLGLTPCLTATAQTSTIDYRNSTSTGSLEKRTATETSLATSFKFGSYNTAVTNPNEATLGNDNDVFQLTNQYSAQISGRALVWRQDNSTTYLPSSVPSVQVNTATPLKSQVLLTFSREVTGLTFVIQDIDLSTLTSSASTGGSDYTDEVDFYPLDGDGQPVDMSPGNVTGSIGNPNTCTYYGPTTIDGKKQVALRGTGLNGTISGPSRRGNVTITFVNPVKTMLLTYRNLNTFRNSDFRLQTIAFEQIAWCSQADLTTTIVNSDTGTLVAGKTGKFTVTFSNVGDLDTDNVQAQVKLAPFLSNVTATNGGLYNPQTGIVTYPTTAIAPYGGKLSSVISYTAPAAKTLVTATATITTTTSQGLDPSPNTATATATPVGPLPVALTAFAAQAVGRDARLTWTTASEQNNDYFGVERSLDGQAFTQVGRVAGHGTALVANSYNYTDAAVASRAAGPVYYRLHQVDLDGTSTYSPVRTVSFDGAGAVAGLGLYPNPAAPTDAAVTLDLRTLPLGAYDVNLVSALGSTVAHYPVQGGQSQALTLPATLASGAYLVLVQGNGLRLSQRLARH